MSFNWRMKDNKWSLENVWPWCADTISLNPVLSSFTFQKDLIVMNEILDVMAVDALASSHPLSSKEADVQKPEQINELFDSITYSKVQYNWG